MIPSEILKRIRAIEIKTRRVVNSTFSGEYHSVFKGQGMSFAEVKDYHPGDDIRLIDWNVTARMQSPFIKVFEEERELTVMLMVDLSGSGDFGTSEKTKVEIAAEIAGVLGFSAIKNQDKVGLLLFTDQVERYIPPKKSKSHILRILRDIFYCNPESKLTSLKAGLEYMNNIMKKKCIVFLISDFMDDGYETSLKAISRRHDVIPIIIEDPKEIELPQAGLITLEDEETGHLIHVNSNSKHFRETFKNLNIVRQNERDRLFKKLSLTAIHVKTDEPYIEPLLRYFKTRSKK